MRQNDCRGDKSRNFFAGGSNSIIFIVVWVWRLFANCTFGIFKPDIPVRIALKGTGFDPFEGAGAVPGPLVVSVKDAPAEIFFAREGVDVSPGPGA